MFLLGREEGLISGDLLVCVLRLMVEEVKHAVAWQMVRMPTGRLPLCGGAPVLP